MSTPVASGAPAAATAVLANLTMTGGLNFGYITADAAKCTLLVPGPQSKSNGNHGFGTSIANLSVVPVDPDGRFCVYNSHPVDLIADVQGYLACAAPPAARYSQASRQPYARRDSAWTLLHRLASAPAASPVTDTACRLRVPLACYRQPHHGRQPDQRLHHRRQVLRAGGRPTDEVEGNHPASTAIANLSVVPVDADGAFCIYNEQPVHLVADLQGSFSPTAPTGLTFTPSTVTRKLDTRQPPFSTPDAGSITRVDTWRRCGYQRCARQPPDHGRQHVHRLHHRRQVLCAGGRPTNEVERQPPLLHTDREPVRRSRRHRWRVLHLQRTARRPPRRPPRNIQPNRHPTVLPHRTWTRVLDTRGATPDEESQPPVRSTLIDCTGAGVLMVVTWPVLTVHVDGAVRDRRLDRLDHSVGFEVMDQDEAPDAAGVRGIDGDVAGQRLLQRVPLRAVTKPRQSAKMAPPAGWTRAPSYTKCPRTWRTPSPLRWLERWGV